MSTETAPPQGCSALDAALAEIGELPEDGLAAALSARNLDPETLEEILRASLPAETIARFHKLLIAAARSDNKDDAALAARLSPLMDPERRLWQRFRRAKDDGEILETLITDVVKGGLVADVGLRAFIPGSQVGLGGHPNLKRYVGQTLRVRVLQLDRRRQTVIMTHRQVLEEERASKKREALSSVQVGEKRQGIVKRITDIGAFVDIGGVDGLLHISEISWNRVESAADVLKPRQKIEVLILRCDPEAGRVSLSLRRLQPNPWEAARTRFSPGQLVTGVVRETVPAGAVIRLTEDIEGFLPIRELANERVAAVEDVVKVGQELQLVVRDLDMRERRITLSLRDVKRRQERQEMNQYRRRARQQAAPPTTLGDLFGHLFQDAQPEAAPAPSETAAPAKPEEQAAAKAPETPTSEPAAQDSPTAEPLTDAEAPPAPEAIEAEAAPGLSEPEAISQPADTAAAEELAPQTLTVPAEAAAVTESVETEVEPGPPPAAAALDNAESHDETSTSAEPESAEA